LRSASFPYPLSPAYRILSSVSRRIETPPSFSFRSIFLYRRALAQTAREIHRAGSCPQLSPAHCS
jgi:hypothetical protein